MKLKFHRESLTDYEKKSTQLSTGIPLQQTIGVYTGLSKVIDIGAG